MEMKRGHKQTEVGVIPEDWEVRPLLTAVRIAQGQVDPKIEPYKSMFLVGPAHVESGTGKLVNRQTAAEQGAISGKYLFAEGDIIYGKINPYLQKAFLADFSGLCSADMYPLKPSKDVSPGFMLAVILGHRFTKYAESVSVRSGMPKINRAEMAEFIFPIPSDKAEQAAIAEALSDADALIESLEQLLAKKRQLKQGAMQELLTGKKRLPGFSGEWEVKAFGEIAQPRRERIDPRRVGPNDFCIELEHIEQGNGRLVGYTATSEDSSLKSVFYENDVLFGKLRAYLRKYWFAIRSGVCSTEIWVLVARQTVISPEFLFELVTTDRFIEAASSAYGTHMPRSDWNVVQRYEVLLPPLPEQAAIVAILSDMDAEIAALETKLAKARLLKQGMMQELLTGRIRLV